MTITAIFPEKTHFTNSVSTGEGECALKRGQGEQRERGGKWSADVAL